MITEITIGVIIGGGVAWLLIMLYFKIQKKKLSKNYNPHDDKSRPVGEGKQPEVIWGGGTAEATGTEPEVTEREPSVAGLAQPQRQELLPTTEADVDGKTDISNGKGSKSLRKRLGGKFRKFRRKPRDPSTNSTS